MHTMRRVGLVLIGCVLASLTLLATLILWLGPALGIACGLGAATVVLTGYITVIGPWQRRWGASDEDIRRPMPGDELLRPEAPSTTRAITIDATPRDVFPWLLQIGYGRGGWYSYDWIDNDGRRSIDRIDPALQVLSVGDRIEMLPGFGPVVREIVPEHHVLSSGDNDTWCLLIQALPDGRSRLLSRWRQDWPKTLGTKVWTMVCDPGAFVMEQKMLRTIRDLSERHVPAATRISNAPMKMELLLSLILIASVMWTIPAGAAPGDLDRTFGGDGKVVTNLTVGRDSAADMAIQPNGKIVVVGRTVGRHYGKFALVRYRTDGRLDTTFGGNGIVTTNLAKREDSASAVAIQPDGKIVVVGTANIASVNYVFAIARYERDGTLDTQFGRGGKVRVGFSAGGDDSAADVAIQPDGKVVVVGTSYVLDEFALARLDPNGSLDTSFDGDGRVTTSVGPGGGSAQAVAIQPDGKIVVAGESWALSGFKGIDVVRYETDGQVDLAFGNDGVATVELTEGSGGAGDMARAVAIQPDGKIVVAGDAGGDAEYTSSFGLGRFDADGVPDGTFDGDGKVVTNFTKWDDSASDLTIGSDGRIVAAGVAGYGWDSVATFAIVRYDPDGTLDGSFGRGGKLRTRFRVILPDEPVGIVGAGASGISIQADGRIVVAGTVDRVADGRMDGRFGVARYRNR